MQLLLLGEIVATSESIIEFKIDFQIGAQSSNQLLETYLSRYTGYSHIPITMNFGNKVNILIQKRNASLFGNLGQTLKNITPKPHEYFKITKPFGIETPPKHEKDVPKEKLVTLEKLNLPKRLWNFYFDGVTRRTKVSKIQKELAYGGMYDFHVFMRTKGKMFHAPISYFKRDKSLFFPNFKLRNLKDQNVQLMDVISQSKITILRVFSTESGSECIKDYFKLPTSHDDNYLSETGIEQLHQEFPQTQIVEICLSDSLSKHFVHTFVTPSQLRKKLPESQHDKYLVAMRDNVITRDDRERLLMTNTYAGYVYLLDDSCRIRWAGSGLPEAKEVTGLWKAVTGLEKEASLRMVRTVKK